MCGVILAEAGVAGIEQMKARLFGNKIYMDVEISVNALATLNEAYNIAQNVHNTIEKQFPKVKHCMVCANPAKEL